MYYVCMHVCMYVYIYIYIYIWFIGSAPQVDPCVSTFFYLAIHDMVLVQQPSGRNPRFLQVQFQFVKLRIR